MDVSFDHSRMTGGTNITFDNEFLDQLELFWIWNFLDFDAFDLEIILDLKKFLI